MGKRLPHCSVHRGQLLSFVCPGRSMLSLLQVLGLADNPYLQDDGVTSVMSSLEGGHVPLLRELDLKSACMLTPTGGISLSRTLSSQRCLHLESLGLRSALPNRQGKHQFLLALQKGVVPYLRQLDLRVNYLGSHEGHMLGEALASGVCGRLEELKLCGNGMLGDEGESWGWGFHCEVPCEG